MTFQMYVKERELESEQKGREENLIENLRSIMKKLNLSADNAMNFLEIPNEKRARLLILLNQPCQ